MFQTSEDSGTTTLGQSAYTCLDHSRPKTRVKHVKNDDMNIYERYCFISSQTVCVFLFIIMLHFQLSGNQGCNNFPSGCGCWWHHHIAAGALQWLEYVMWQQQSPWNVCLEQLWLVIFSWNKKLTRQAVAHAHISHVFWCRNGPDLYTKGCRRKIK